MSDLHTDSTAADDGPPTPADAATTASDAVAPDVAQGNVDGAESAGADSAGEESDGGDGAGPATGGPKKRRRGSRGGKGRKKPGATGVDDAEDGDELDAESDAEPGAEGGADDDAMAEGVAPITPRPRRTEGHRVERTAKPKRTPSEPAEPAELPERLAEGRPSAAAAEQALVRRPQIGDTRPAPPPPPGPARVPASKAESDKTDKTDKAAKPAAKKRRRGGKGKAGSSGPAVAAKPTAVVVDPEVLERRRGRERNGRPVGRYLMCVQVRPTLTQVAVLEGRNLIEHYVSRPADDISQIHGNIYLGKVQNVLPGMEAAFVDIGTPKNAVLYRGDVQYDAEDIVEKSNNLRIEQMLKAKQLIICQVTKNPIGAKGARLTQEVSLPGRFVVLIPNSRTYGISKRLPDDVRKRLRNILDRVKPAEHGLIVRTAAEHATEHELRADMTRLLDQWNAIEAKAKKANSATLLYREPELAVRVIREEFNAEYRGIVIDDQRLFDDVKDYVGAFNPELADRVEYFDSEVEGLPIFELHHVHEQLHKALDRKVWLPSGGSLIIEHTEALTVIDVNTGKNVGKDNLEETVYRNNLEAAAEVAKQLRLRDIGGIVVIDFIDMEIRENRRKVTDSFREALARDKTRTQVFEISELGLVEMTRKRIGEGLLTNFADQCPNCEGRGVVIDHALLE